MTKAKDDKIIGLRQKQLCERFGWRYQEIAQQAKALGLSTHAYVQQKTGWRLIEELYYPPLENVHTEDDLNLNAGA